MANNGSEIRYGMCVRNHGAARGENSFDGCEEFVPTRAALTCAVCGCHRSFHLRDDDEFGFALHPTEEAGAFASRVLGVPSSHHRQALHHLILCLAAVQRYHGAQAVAEAAPPPPPSPVAQNVQYNDSLARKLRCPTLNEHQMARMKAFGEQIGWSVHARNKDAVLAFCAEVRVGLDNFIVWLYLYKALLDAAASLDVAAVAKPASK